MLVNMLGVEQVDDVVDLNDRRQETPTDPKSRVTLTTLFGTVLAAFIAAGSSAPPPRTASVVEHDFVVDEQRDDRDRNTNAA